MSGAEMGEDFLGNWQEAEDAFLFFSAPAHETVAALVEKQPELRLLDRFQMPYEQWLGERFTRFRAGSFFIRPPWEPPVPLRENDHEIRLDPGVVFGTGTHATTRDCLAALQALPWDGRIRRVLDLGTGTGLLALAAARMGACSVLAMDLNFLAARTAARNIRLNGLERQVLALCGRAEEGVDGNADLLIANIHYAVMKPLIRSRGFLEKNWFILSGLLRGEAEALARQLAEYPVEIIRGWERDGVWHTFLGKRR